MTRNLPTLQLNLAEANENNRGVRVWTLKRLLNSFDSGEVLYSCNTSVSTAVKQKAKIHTSTQLWWKLNKITSIKDIAQGLARIVCSINASSLYYKDCSWINCSWINNKNNNRSSAVLLNHIHSIQHPPPSPGLSFSSHGHNTPTPHEARVE